MRKEFSSWLKKTMSEDASTVFLTGDLGFQAFEAIHSEFKERAINVGVAEQNMILVAAGLASEGLLPICYSIAPFAVFRPLEQIRLNLAIHDYKAIIVGNGGGYGYGMMGASHHALEDVAVLSCLPHFKCFVPICNQDLLTVADQAYRYAGPSYLRLGYGIAPIVLPDEYSEIRQLIAGEKATVFAFGPTTSHAFNAIQSENLSCDLFALSEAPIASLPAAFIQSVRKTGQLVILEEHVKRGGVGEMLSLLLLELGVQCKITHRFALGYPNKAYGSQNYHLKISGLDESSIRTVLKEIGC